MKKARDGSQIKLDWFFIDRFLRLAKDKPGENGSRLQQTQEAFRYNGEDFVVCFYRGKIK